MTIIVEDGSIVTNANSYVTRADYITYAAAHGITIADDANADVELIGAAQFIGQHEVRMIGHRVTRDQSLAYPRYDVEIEDWYWAHDEIPRQLILCQLAYALDINAGIDLWNKPVNPNIFAKKERVEGAVAVEYAISDKTGQKLTRTSKGDALLALLLVNSGLISITLERR